MFKGFRDFLLRGNVIDLAVAVVIGTAFVALIGAFTAAFIDPLIRLVLPGDGIEAGVLTIGGEDFDFTLVAGDFMDLDGGHVSLASPIGRGLLGAKQGEEVKVSLPAGDRRYKIVTLLTLPQQLEAGASS